MRQEPSVTDASAVPADSTVRTGWFEASRFGLFVHFGLYSLAARHEWVRSREAMSQQEYDRYLHRFDPDLFDARQLARTARESGMRYAVLTAKHHDGFCLFGSALSEYTSMHATGRDLVREFVDAMRAEGLRVGLYYSLLDWHHPDFTVDEHHPLRDTEARREPRDMARYREYMKGQIRELLTEYGRIDLLFFDFTYPEKGPEEWGSRQLLDLARELQPGIVVNDRLGIPGDYVTPEQYQPDRPLERDGERVMWEACHTLNGSWGYDRDNHDYKDPALLVRMLVESVACGGNLILNVGPTGRGALDPRARDTLRAIGEWTELHARSVHGAGPSAFETPANALYTQSGTRLYLHLPAWPLKHLHLPGLAGRVRYAQLLHDGSEIRFHEMDGARHEHNNLAPPSQPAGTLTLTLPVARPDVLLPVIELVLDGEE
ncbi:alpha-L-fucosidase [Streptomyces sp. NBC_00825]|uniref:alpha-L-fucosidase n=2 Tax=Streptomyces TaxID=1883 RepID=UPI00224E395E|nr:alpha-L-fucosidase [Streptomyces sp. NBC_00906]MCX4900573.1 alpha-L-fucosidase [Streptomyces sp. NBC_00892]MCX5433944.1 alpha-L-fucosidase [Streptomyces sp. NBC_00062]WTB59538.1 alpha-L-fucosidase [Streptomyces sp. NBC_00826]WTH95879.1 alpha-L-fucosidase [Streptomyces sp. NBC_00825]WTI04600.1 alpha-L-fucosidase [Streptomyces sp. NBC_00822]